MRTLLVSLLLILSLPMRSQTYVGAIDLRDSTLIYAIYHVQVKMEKHHRGTLDLYWNRLDSNNYIKATLHIPSIIDLDPNHPAQITTKIIQRTAGVDSLLLEHKSNTVHTDQMSLRLKARYGKAVLQAGSHKLRQQFEVPIDFNHPGAFGTSCTDNLTGTRHTLIYATEAKPPVYQGLTSGQIIEQLKQINDPVAGFWQYFDRDIPRQRVQLAHKYTLAILPDDDGYLIIDITNPDGPLPLKGQLTPTIFKDNYNLVWYPAKGPVQNDDCYAELSLEGHLLNLQMPVINSSFRLYRMPEKEINALNEKKSPKNLEN